MWNSLLWTFHAVILMMVSTGQTEDDTGNELSEYLNDYVIAVNDVSSAAETALENIPHINQMYDVEDSPQLSIVEKAVKSSLLNKLVQQLLEIWVEIQVLKLGGHPVLQSLLENAKELFQKIKELGGESIVTGKEFLDKLWDKVRDILDLSRKVMCDRHGKFTGSFAWEYYQNITKGLDILVIKEKLLKKLDELDLQSITFVQSSTSERHTDGDFISQWAYFAVRQVIKDITNPMGRLQTIVLKYVFRVIKDLQVMINELLRYLLEIFWFLEQFGFVIELNYSVSQNNKVIYICE